MEKNIGRSVHRSGSFDMMDHLQIRSYLRCSIARETIVASFSMHCALPTKHHSFLVIIGIWRRTFLALSDVGQIHVHHLEQLRGGKCSNVRPWKSREPTHLHSSSSPCNVRGRDGCALSCGARHYIRYARWINAHGGETGQLVADALGGHGAHFIDHVRENAWSMNVHSSIKDG